MKNIKELIQVLRVRLTRASVSC